MEWKAYDVTVSFGAFLSVHRETVLSGYAGCFINSMGRFFRSNKTNSENVT